MEFVAFHFVCAGLLGVCFACSEGVVLCRHRMNERRLRSNARLGRAPVLVVIHDPPARLFSCP
jgi:hypothetical protein